MPQHSIEHTLGVIETHILHIRDKVDATAEEVAEIKIVGIQTQASAISAHSRIDSMKENVDTFVTARAQGQGAAKAIYMLGAFVVSGVGLVFGWWGSIRDIISTPPQ